MRRKCDFSDEFVRYVVSPLHKKKETATFMNVTWYSVVSWEPVEVSIQAGLGHTCFNSYFSVSIIKMP